MTEVSMSLIDNSWKKDDHKTFLNVQDIDFIGIDTSTIFDQ
jgi:hypothetical protein